MKEHTTATAMWNIIKLKFDIICASKIVNITAKVINKAFSKFTTIKEYYWAYQEAYNNIASWFANKNWNQDQIKYYKVLLQGVLFDKLSKAYASFISAIDKN